MPSQSIGLTIKKYESRTENARFWHAIKLFTFFKTIKFFFIPILTVKKISITKTTGLVSFCLYIVSKCFEEKQN